MIPIKDKYELLVLHCNTWKYLILCKNKCVMLNGIWGVESQYLKPFNYVQNWIIDIT